jgi:hypothetical protein
MKRIFAALTVCALALAIGGTALAQGPNGRGCRTCNQCDQGGQGSQGKVESDPFRKFRQDTLDLRQEMMNKRFELQRENLKATPDTARIAGLKADISLIQAKINDIRLQSGLPDKGKRDGECYRADGGCNKRNGMGGCNGEPCWQR